MAAYGEISMAAVIWHPDQGSQFVSLACGQQARAAGIAQSMGSRGGCFDSTMRHASPNLRVKTI
jgi:transposase InsO family protein